LFRLNNKEPVEDGGIGVGVGVGVEVDVEGVATAVEG